MTTALFNPKSIVAMRFKVEYLKKNRVLQNKKRNQ